LLNIFANRSSFARLIKDLKPNWPAMRTKRREKTQYEYYRENKTSASSENIKNQNEADISPV